MIKVVYTVLIGVVAAAVVVSAGWFWAVRGSGDEASFDRYACTLDPGCEGSGCARLAARFDLVPEGPFGRGILVMEGRPPQLAGTRPDAQSAAREFFNGDNDRGNLRITFEPGGAVAAVTLEEPATSGRIVAQASAACDFFPAEANA